MKHEETTQTDRHAAAQRTAILADFRATFTSDSGRNVLAALKQSTGWGKPSFLPAPGGGPIDPYAAACRDGRKSVIDEILAILATPEDDPGGKPQGRR